MAEISNDPALQCKRCGENFTEIEHLTRHVRQKTPCDPAPLSLEVDHSSKPEKINKCQECGKVYSTRGNLHRHIRTTCKFKKFDRLGDATRKAETFNKLLHVANELIGETKVVDICTEALISNISSQMVVSGLSKIQDSNPQTNYNIVNAAIQNNVVQNNTVQTIQNNIVQNNVVQNNIVQNNIVIIPWDSDSPITITAEDITAAFADNAKLQDYMQLHDYERTDMKVAPPYVAEMYVDLIRKVHQNPAAQNIYLNPKRSDQVLVYHSTGQWKILCLSDASARLLSGVHDSMGKIVLSADGLAQIPPDTLNAASIARMMYNAEPEEYAKLVKAPLVAHLANNASSAGK